MTGNLKRTLKNCVYEDNITFDARIFPKQDQKRKIQTNLDYEYWYIILNKKSS